MLLMLWKTVVFIYTTEFRLLKRSALLTVASHAVYTHLDTLNNKGQRPHTVATFLFDV